MSKAFILHLILSSLLFIYANINMTNTPKKFHRVSSKKSVNYQKYQQLLRITKNQEASSFLIASTLGEKSFLKKKTKKKFQKLQLLHLFTPSGLHLSSIWLILFPLFNLLQRITSKGTLILKLILLTYPILASFPPAITRLSLMRLMTFSMPKKFNIKITTIFYITFLLDFLFGTYKQSPLSFNYSFIFIGALLCGNSFSPLSLFFRILVTQFLISLIGFTQLNIMGAFLGFLLTTLFTVVFPFIFLFFFATNFLEIYWIKFILDSYLILIDICYKLSTNFSDLFITLPLLLGLISLGFKKKYLLIFFFLISSSPALNYSLSTFKRSHYFYSKKVSAHKVLKKYSTGYLIQDKQGREWKVKLERDRWRARPRF